MNTYLLKRIAATTISATLCLSVVSCHDGAVSFGTENTENESVHVTMNEQEVTTNTPTVIEATEHFVNTKEIIDRTIDNLMVYKNDIYPSKNFIATHVEAFKDVLDLGEDAVIYLQSLVDTESTYTKSIADILLYQIRPDLYEKTFFSPNGRYRVQASPDDIVIAEDIRDYSDLRLYLNETNEMLYKNNGSFRNLQVHWDDDVSYVWISHGILNYEKNVILIDLQRGITVDLLTIDEIKQYITDHIKTFSNTDLSLYSRYSIEIETLPSKTAPYIGVLFSFSFPTSSEIVIGRYHYDILTNEVDYMEAEIKDMKEIDNIEYYLP